MTSASGSYDRRCGGCFEPFEGSGCAQPACAEEVPNVLPRSVRVGDRYLIGRVLGRGGFGVTYLAWDQSTQERVAVKEYFPLDISTRTRDNQVRWAGTKHRDPFEFGKARFLEEGNTLHQLADVAGVVPTRGVFEENGTAYLVMEYIHGETLQAYARRLGGRLNVEEALNVCRSVLRTLAAIHTRDWLHRDISPDNIYLVGERSISPRGRQTSLRLRDGTQVQVMLLDFGAARQALGGRTQNLEVVLKQGYAPLEQYRSRVKLGPPTDLYALSATLYELLTGSTPMQATDRAASAENARLDWPRDVVQNVAPQIRRAIERGLAVSSAERPQSATALEQELFAERTHGEQPSPDTPGTQTRTRPGDYIIGRRDASQIAIPDDTVSGNHAVLSVLASGGIRLCDQNSTNGTFVLRNGALERIGRLGAAIAADDIVRFGDVDVLVEDLLARLPTISARMPNGTGPGPGQAVIEQPVQSLPVRPDGPPSILEVPPVLSAVDGSPGRRLGAQLLDSLVFSLVFGAAAALDAILAANNQYHQDSTAAIGPLAAVLGWLLVGTIQLVMLARSGQTLGKRWLGLRIVDASTLQHAGFGRTVMIRSVLNGVAWGVPVVGWIYFIVDVCFIFGDGHRCVHDHLASTRVIRV